MYLRQPSKYVGAVASYFYHAYNLWIVGTQISHVINECWYVRTGDRHRSSSFAIVISAANSKSLLAREGISDAIEASWLVI